MTGSRTASVMMVACVLVTCACCASDTGAESEQASIEAAPVAIRVALGGDVMFGRWSDGRRIGHDDPGIWRAAGQVFAGADVSVVNLESALCSDDTASGVSERVPIQLTAPASRASFMAEAGVDVASIANNHATDCGPHSVDDTVGALEAADVDAVGVSRRPPTQRRVRDTRLIATAATIFPPAITPARQASSPALLARRDVDPLIETTRHLRASHPDAWLLVSIHWGRELAAQPDGWQREVAHALVDAGADIVHGHGSHTVQEVESYRGGAIAYGLGNLHFDMSYPATQQRAVAMASCRDRGERRCDIELVRLR